MEHTDTLADILAIRFAGNHASDMHHFNRIERFIMRANVPLDDKQRAYDHYVVKGMGMDAEDVVPAIAAIMADRA